MTTSVGALSANKVKLESQLKVIPPSSLLELLNLHDHLEDEVTMKALS